MSTGPPRAFGPTAAACCGWENAQGALALAKHLDEAVRAQGYDRKGTHALMLALEHLSNVKR